MVESPNERFECPDCGSLLLLKNFKINSKGFNVCPLCSHEFRINNTNEFQSSFFKIDSNTIKDFSIQYREIRYSVYNEATKQNRFGRKQHDLNKSIFKEKVLEICNNANLKMYYDSSQETTEKIWHHLWTKNRYAGIKAQIASNEIEDIESIFDDYKVFSNPSWDVQSSGHTLISAGREAQNFLNRKGKFSGKQTIGNLPKLVKIVAVARELIKYTEQHKNQPAINFITNEFQIEDVWNIHNHLISIGYTGDLTALHFMMDLGFQVMKPDIIISRLFLKLGWLHKIISNLPKNITQNDLQGKGNYGLKYLYTKPHMYKPIIELSRIISRETSKDSLVDDIGWATENPLREFDIFMVKFGQKPEPNWGIVKTLMS